MIDDGEGEMREPKLTPELIAAAKDRAIADSKRPQLTYDEVAAVFARNTLRNGLAQGHWVRDCPGCQEAIVALEAGKPQPFGPSHKTSPFCESGKRPHCTCDFCF